MFTNQNKCFKHALFLFGGNLLNDSRSTFWKKNNAFRLSMCLFCQFVLHYVFPIFVQVAARVMIVIHFLSFFCASILFWCFANQFVDSTIKKMVVFTTQNQPTFGKNSIFIESKLGIPIKSEAIRWAASCACHKRHTWQVQKLQIAPSFRKTWIHKLAASCARHTKCIS